MAKRSKWLIQKTKIIPVAIRDTEFAEILAALGQLVYDELSSLPGSVRSTDVSSHPTVFEIASQKAKEGCA
jgi:hypothetical protein